VSATVLILRPSPGAEETAARAAALGLVPVTAPLFTVRPERWEPPDPATFDAVMLTSANAARLAGPGLAAFLGLPCYAVGEATAAAARGVGFREVHAGPSDGAALLDLIAAAGIASVFHPCGRDRKSLPHPRVRTTPVRVYASEAADRLPAEALAALRDGALALLHSPRAGEVFGRLVGADRADVSIAAISAAAAAAAGYGWKSISVATQPRDEALLELAAKLCQTDAR
jgi:uroporphyrinogen-III synthase